MNHLFDIQYRINEYHRLHSSAQHILNNEWKIWKMAIANISPYMHSSALDALSNQTLILCGICNGFNRGKCGLCLSERRLTHTVEWTSTRRFTVSVDLKCFNLSSILTEIACFLRDLKNTCLFDSRYISLWRRYEDTVG